MRIGTPGSSLRAKLVGRGTIKQRFDGGGVEGGCAGCPSTIHSAVNSSPTRLRLGRKDAHQDPAIVCALHSHGEHRTCGRLIASGAPASGGLVRGARGRRMRPVLMAGDTVEAQLSARTDTQLPQALVELVHSRGRCCSSRFRPRRSTRVTVLTSTALPEGQPYPHLFEALEGLLDAIEAAPSASRSGRRPRTFRLLLLAELGFGLDLTVAR